MRRYLRGIIKHACDRYTTTLDSRARTADGAGVDDLHISVPTMSLRVLKRIPLSRSRVALYKGNDETDDGQDVQSNAESQKRSLDPMLRSEEPNDEDRDTQFGQRNTEEGPGIGENDPESGRRDGLE